MYKSPNRLPKLYVNLTFGEAFVTTIKVNVSSGFISLKTYKYHINAFHVNEYIENPCDFQSAKPAVYFWTKDSHAKNWKMRPKAADFLVLMLLYDFRYIVT